jgi:DNA polymerase-3 subunit delta
MIIKSFEINKIDPFKNNLILFYGQNEGLKDENIIKLSSKFHNIIKYHEREILENQDNFFESIFSGSLFDENKFVIINQASDKIVKIIEILIEKKEKIKEIAILLNANSLEKKSKLRSIFEKNLLCVPFYIDNNETLFKFTETFLKQKKINISPLNINFLINKCNGDRRNLKNELHKIEMFCLNKRNIKDEELQKLVCLSENKNINELIDCCLVKDEKNTINILNDNIFNNDDSILITRTFLNKLKKIHKLILSYEKNKNLNETIKNAKPPIFWKDKPIVEKQIKTWKPDLIEKLIVDINEIELQIKKNNTNSINLISDFILNTAA